MPLALRVNGAAKARKHVGPTVGFVQDHKLFALCKLVPFKVKAQPLGLLLKIEVKAAKRFRERSLAALARPHKRDGGKRRKPARKFAADMTREHPCRLEIYFYFARGCNRREVR